MDSRRDLQALIDKVHARQIDEEVREIWMGLDEPARCVWMYLGRLYITAAADLTDAGARREILRVESAIRDDDGPLPDVPALQ